MDDNEEEGSFERIIIPNERDGAPGAFPQIVSQIDCFTYSSEHDIPSDGTFRSCVNFYKYADHKSEVLFAMTIGLMDYDKMVSEPPFSLVKRKNTLAVFQPSNRCLQQEIARRCHFLSAEYVHDEDHPLWNEKKKKVIIPRPKQWQRGPLFEWLKSYRYQYRSEDEEFLIEEVTRLKKVIEQALETDNYEKKKGSSTAPFWDGRSGWSSLTPNLRLIEIVLLPRLRGDFLARDNVLSRQALDARGTVHEPVSFWEKIQTLFNDESFVVESIILDSSWGGRFFLQPINLGWEMLK